MVGQQTLLVWSVSLTAAGRPPRAPGKQRAAASASPETLWWRAAGTHPARPHRDSVLAARGCTWRPGKTLWQQVRWEGRVGGGGGHQDVACVRVLLNSPSNCDQLVWCSSLQICSPSAVRWCSSNRLMMVMWTSCWELKAFCRINLCTHTHRVSILRRWMAQRAQSTTSPGSAPPAAPSKSPACRHSCSGRRGHGTLWRLWWSLRRSTLSSPLHGCKDTRGERWSVCLYVALVMCIQAFRWNWLGSTDKDKIAKKKKKKETQYALTGSQ